MVVFDRYNHSQMYIIAYINKKSTSVTTKYQISPQISITFIKKKISKEVYGKE